MVKNIYYIHAGFNSIPQRILDYIYLTVILGLLALTVIFKDVLL